MTNDLQAARERVRRVKELGDDGDAIRKVYRHQMERLRDEDHEAWGRSKPIDYITPDYALLADAYCELFDETPIDEEWLNNNPLALNFITKGHGSWTLNLYPYHPLKATISTIGQVRLLLLAMGVER